MPIELIENHSKFYGKCYPLSPTLTLNFLKILLKK